MPKKQSSKPKTSKSSSKSSQKNEITYIIIMIASLILMLCLYFSSNMGWAGTTIQSLMRGLFGVMGYVFPIYLATIMLIIIIKKNFNQCKGKYIASAIWFLCIMGIVMFAYGVKGTPIGTEEGAVSTYAQYWQKYWDYGQKLYGAGIIGEIIYRPLSLFMGFGAGIFYIGLFVVLSIYIFDFSLLSVFNRKEKSDKYAVVDTADDESEEKKDSKKIAAIIPPKKSASKKDEIPEAEILEKETDEEYEGPEIKIYNQDQTGLAGVFENEEKGKPLSKKDTPTESDDKINEEMKNDLDKANEEVSFMHYEYPDVALLSSPQVNENSTDIEEGLSRKSAKLEETLKSFGVAAKVTEISMGPTVTRFELTPEAGVKVSKITGLSKDIALNLAAKNVRIEAPIPGKSAVGIEIPNETTNAVTLREVIEADVFAKSKSKLSVALGKDISGKPIIMDISKMPHLLIAGATGSGKSVCINTLVVSLLYKADPNEVKLVMIDPKVVELGVYNGIPHLLIPVVTDPKKAAGALNWAVSEMTDRYSKFADNNVRDIKGYNELMELNGTPEMKLSSIVIIIDELADLMMVSPADVENYICRLAQMARAAGMHLVIATQRPSVNVITGTIKANIPSRISFAVTSQIDSRTVLDMGGAEKLLGKGDMLYMPMGASSPTRLQCSYVSDKEVEAVVQAVSKDCAPNYQADIIERLQSEEVYRPEGDDPGENDEFLPQAIEMAIDNGTISTSLLQRRFRIGYNRAGSIIDQMEQRGIISGLDGNKPRKVLITRDEYNEMIASGNM